MYICNNITDDRPYIFHHIHSPYTRSSGSTFLDGLLQYRIHKLPGLFFYFILVWCLFLPEYIFFPMVPITFFIFVEYPGVATIRLDFLHVLKLPNCWFLFFILNDISLNTGPLFSTMPKYVNPDFTVSILPTSYLQFILILFCSYPHYRWHK